MAEAAIDMVVISGEELRKHRTPQDCWIAVHSKVYDVTEFLEEHPGGAASKFLLFTH
jgi:L-lactate dehydrogenase (cytochrome)